MISYSATLFVTIHDFGTSTWCHSYGAGSRFEPSQREMALLCNDVSDWLGANLESALFVQNERRNEAKFFLQS